MWVRILGSAAGGGFPQWNCNCPNCRGVRAGSRYYRPRTQSSIAVSADYRHWFLFNASPDIRDQIAAFPPLWPRRGVRDTAIEGVVLTDAEIDHTLGLLALREARSLRLYATAAVHAALTDANPLLRTLRAYCEVAWQPVRLGQAAPLSRRDGAETGLRCVPFATGSAKPVAFAPDAAGHPEASVGYRLSDARTGGSLVYAPALPELSATTRQHMAGCTCLLVDGTCWDDDELLRLGIAGGKTARAMGHLPIAGADGSLEQFPTLAVGRTVYVHLNNTNPVLNDDSPERRAVAARGIEVGCDGMELEV